MTASPFPAAAELTAYLHRHLPPAAALRVEVADCAPGRLRLTAPLTANLNPHGTAFAGSQTMLGILAGWTLLFARLRQAGLTADVVIRDSHFSFRRPVTDDFWAEARLTEAQWQDFRADLAGNGRARLRLSTAVGDTSGPCGRHEGLYVALGEKIP